MTKTIFIPATGNFFSSPISNRCMTRVRAAFELCRDDPSISHLYFVGGGAANDFPSVSARMVKEFESMKHQNNFAMASAIDSSRSTFGNVQEILYKAKEENLSLPIKILSHKRHFKRLSKHANRLGYTIEEYYVEDFIKEELTKKELVIYRLSAIILYVVELVEILDPDEKLISYIRFKVRGLKK